MNGFIFQNATRLYFGLDQLKNLGLEIKKYSGKVLIAYSGGATKSGIIKGYRDLTWVTLSTAREIIPHKTREHFLKLQISNWRI